MRNNILFIEASKYSVIFDDTFVILLVIITR